MRTGRAAAAAWERPRAGAGSLRRPRASFRVQPYAFMAPAILLVLGVSFYPALFAIRRSFYATRYMELGRFIGLEHYVRFLGRGAGWQSIGNSLTYTAASLWLALPLGFLLALILHQPLPCRAVIRTILILPWIVSQTIVALLWGWLLNPNYGPVSYLAGAWSAWRLDVFGTPEWAMAGVVLANVWQSYAFPMVLLLAALQTIPAEVVEAARVDGASPWAAFWRITLPLVRPTLLITAIMLTLHYFNMVTLIFTLTGGGPGGATETLSVRVFNEAFVFHNLGFASMVGVIIFFLNAAFSLSYIRVLQREP